MQETKYTMSLSIEDWEKVINGLTETERTSAKLRSTIIAEINAQTDKINQAITKMGETKQNGE